MAKDDTYINWDIEKRRLDFKFKSSEEGMLVILSNAI